MLRDFLKSDAMRRFGWISGKIRDCNLILNDRLWAKNIFYYSLKQIQDSGNVDVFCYFVEGK